MMRIIAGASLIALALLGGCVGTSAVGFYTTDNLGVSVTSLPQPSAEISFARNEGVIEPGFENGSVPSVAASVQHKVDSIWKFQQDSRAIFAGGNAARYVAGDVDPSAKDDAKKGEQFKASNASTACVKSVPSTIVKDKNQGALVFGTTSTIGFKISLPVTSVEVPFPDVHLGYNRSEVAIASVFGQENGCVYLGKDNKYLDINGVPIPTDENGNLKDPGQIVGDPVHPHAIYSPSFLAMIQSNENADLPANASAFGVGQVFATGKSAELISQGPNVYGSVATVGSSLAPLTGPFATALFKTRQKALADIMTNVQDTDVAKFASAINLRPPNNTRQDILSKINDAPNPVELSRLELAFRAVRE